jgi:hypothetical protein
MAPQQPPEGPNLRAASGRLRQSTNQLVQASANIPADPGSMSPELDRLEYQPTNQQLVNQVQQLQQQLQQFQQETDNKLAAM